jgi:hypothetical protein
LVVDGCVPVQLKVHPSYSITFLPPRAREQRGVVDFLATDQRGYEMLETDGEHSDKFRHRDSTEDHRRPVRSAWRTCPSVAKSLFASRLG